MVLKDLEWNMTSSSCFFDDHRTYLLSRRWDIWCRLSTTLSNNNWLEKAFVYALKCNKITVRKEYDALQIETGLCSHNNVYLHTFV